MIELTFSFFLINIYIIDIGKINWVSGVYDFTIFAIKLVYNTDTNTTSLRCTCSILLLWLVYYKNSIEIVWTI